MPTKRKTQAEAESWTIDEIEAHPSMGFLVVTKTSVDGVAAAFDLAARQGTPDSPGPVVFRVRIHRHDSTAPTEKRCGTCLEGRPYGHDQVRSPCNHYADSPSRPDGPPWENCRFWKPMEKKP